MGFIRGSGGDITLFIFAMPKSPHSLWKTKAINLGVWGWPHF